MILALTISLLMLAVAALRLTDEHSTAARSVSEDGPRPRIVGGNESLLGEFPYQVSVEVRLPGDDYRHTCGGSIVDTTKVVTAASCVVSWPLGDELRVVAGDVDRARVNGYEQYQSVCSVSIHPKYKLGSQDYNYAVLGLCNPLEFNAYVKAIQMASTEPATRNCQASGWGESRVSDDGTLFPTVSLKNVSLSVVQRSDCSKDYKRIRVNITERLVCAGGSGKGICDGDYGGGLVCEDGTLVGVATFNQRPCGASPGLFASIPAARRWIDAQGF